MKEFLNESEGDPGIIAGICFAMEDNESLSKNLK
jgi:hypothetical protein